jgi:hypothetical protein
MIGSPHTLSNAEAALMAHELIDPTDVKLGDNLDKAFEQLSSSEETAFLHMDPTKVTVGHAQTSRQGDIDLVEKLSANGRPCGVLLGLNSSGFVKLELDDEVKNLDTPSEPKSGQLHLPLGRNVYSANVDSDYREQAIRRMLVPSEKLLVVGDLGITSFVIHAIQMYGTVTGEDAAAALRKRTALVCALDALKEQPAPAAEV